LPSHVVHAQRTGVTEYAIKAAFVCKFAGYVEWPAGAFEQPDSPIVIGVVGEPEVADQVANAARGQAIDARPLAVRRLRPGDPVDGVHVLFVTRARAPQAQAALAAAQRQPVLTVTEQEDGDGPAGIVNFVVVGNKVRFDVAPHLGEPAELRISSRMLSVARRVVPRTS
jgi:hypothetical protein